MDLRVKHFRRGMAMITVLLVSGVIFAFISGGLALGSQHLFQVSSTHSRNQALCAAEAGIYSARYRLEENPSYQGVVTGTLQDGSSYRTVVSHQDGLAVLCSEGKCRASVRRLNVSLSVAPESFNALSAEGKILVDEHSFVNGVQSVSDPRQAPGNMHSNSSADDAIVVNGAQSRLSVTGILSAPGGIQGQVDGNKAKAGAQNLPAFTKEQLLAGQFPGLNIPAGGAVAENTVIHGKLEMTENLYIPEGLTVHVEGDAVLHQGVSGLGTLVVDGNVVLRGTDGLDDEEPEGVLLYSDGDVVVANPQATFTGSAWTTPVDPVGDLFAKAPEDIPYILAQRLPLGAPEGSAFFQWYKKASKNPSPAFREWMKGDGTEKNPGISRKAVAWLEETAPLAEELAQVADPAAEADASVSGSTASRRHGRGRKRSHRRNGEGNGSSGSHGGDD